MKAVDATLLLALAAPLSVPVALGESVAVDPDQASAPAAQPARPLLDAPAPAPRSSQAPFTDWGAGPSAQDPLSLPPILTDSPMASERFGSPVYITTEPMALQEDRHPQVLFAPVPPTLWSGLGLLAALGVAGYVRSRRRRLDVVTRR